MFDKRIKLALVALSWLLTAFFWSRLPALVPTHWGISGQPDGWMPLPWGGLIGALVTTFLSLIFLLLPVVDPRGEHWKQFKESYEFIVLATLSFTTFLTWLTLSTAVRGGELSVSQLLVGIGIVFMIMGNYLPKLRSNFFIGIRSPWTLSSEEVWYRTHRLAGKLMFAMGLVLLLASFASRLWQVYLVFGSLALFATWSIGYSFWLYKKISR
ncbi:MAG TPA: SdpI family protein [Chroococcales cyanobacterium]|jgi:uncharacterized membrane protein